MSVLLLSTQPFLFALSFACFTLCLVVTLAVCGKKSESEEIQTQCSAIDLISIGVGNTNSETFRQDVSQVKSTGAVPTKMEPIAESKSNDKNERYY